MWRQPPKTRDAQGRITQITDPLGKVYTYGYDAFGDLVSLMLPDTYVDGTEDPIRYVYSAGHYLTDALDPRRQRAMLQTYTPEGRLESMTDAVGNTTRNSYDIGNRTTTTTLPDNNTVLVSFDGDGYLLSERDPLNRVTTFAYDAQHNLTARTNDLGESFAFAYDARGNRTSVTDPLGQTLVTVG